MVKKKIGLKILFVGDSGVGKTTLKNRLLGREDGKISSTIGIDISSFKLELSKVNLVFSIFDIGGQKHYSNVRSIYYSNPHLIVMVFDISNQATLINLINWVKELSNSNSINFENTPVIIVGNKIDLKPQVDKNSINFVVDSLRRSGLYIREVIYVSARTGANVDEFYKLMVKESVLGLVNKLKMRKYKSFPL